MREIFNKKSLGTKVAKAMTANKTQNQKPIADTMNTNTDMPMWKKALKWISLALVSLVVLDWLLDGRLRKRMPGKRRERTDDINV